MTNILFVAGRKPYPLDDGWRIRTYHLAKSLASSANYMDAIFFDETGDGAGCGELDDLCRSVSIIHRDKKYSFLNLLRGLLSHTPFSVLNYAENEFARVVKRLISENEYDYIQIEDIVMAQYALGQVESFCVLDMHNVESDLLKRYGEISTNVLKKVYAKITAGKLESYEKVTSNRFDRVLVCSEDDKVKLKNLQVQTPVTVVPNGVDCHYYNTLSLQKSKSLIFIGSMDYHANISGVEFFAKEVMPLLLKKYPEITVYIVGKNPPQSIRALASNNLVVTGAVEDVRPYLEKASISIVPLLVGGGTRLKILEAMATGLPIVSTSLGAEGLEVIHGQNILLADDAVSFAQCIGMLFDQPSLYSKLSQHGKSFAFEKYDWTAIGEGLINQYASWTRRK